MEPLSVEELQTYNVSYLKTLSREALLAICLRVVAFALHLLGRLAADSSNSSRPPSSDDPFRRGSKGEPSAADQPGTAEQADVASAKAKTKDPAKAKPSGKKPGMPGFWRKQPIVPGTTLEHRPSLCGSCGKPFEADLPRRCVGAHHVFELEREAFLLRVRADKHAYFAVTCGCGFETVETPGTGPRSHSQTRKRDLQLTERCLVGPMLASFIVALALRCRLSRGKIKEFLRDWLGLELGKASINRCIHEFGLACAPVVEALVGELQEAGVLHVDETPWYQKGKLRWLWVVASATTVVFRIGDRSRETLVELVGVGYLGWLVTDGYSAYRDRERRQRCLAHLIRKAVALAGGYHCAGVAFGTRLANDLRRLIKRVADGDPPDAIKRLTKKIKWSCEQNQYDVEDKLRGLAREILNDWEAVIAFVTNPLLPPTNNEAERILRHAVLARRISYGTRTDEGSRYYAADLSVVETCRRRGVDPWAYAKDLLANARRGQPPPQIA